MSAHPPHAAAPADVLPDDLPAADLSDNARIVLARRYLKKDDKGRPIEEPEQMFWRVARVIAEEDRKVIFEKFRQVGDPLTERPFMGPLVSEAARARHFAGRVANRDRHRLRGIDRCALRGVGDLPKERGDLLVAQRAARHRLAGAGDLQRGRCPALHAQLLRLVGDDCRKKYVELRHQLCS